MPFTESLIEQAALDWFAGLEYQVVFGPDLAFDGKAPERQDYQTAIFSGRLRDALLPKLMRGEVRTADVR
jgi:type I restriction enzyme, R subunit